MRLGQLARKLEVRPIDLVEFLAKQNIYLEDNANTKIEAAHAALALRHFAPHLQLEDVPDADTQSVETNTVLTTPDAEPVKSTVSSEDTVAASEENPARPEVIKAPKVELSGLKVLGKIDLPEPKKKQPEPAPESAEAETPKDVGKERRSQNLKRQSRPAKNPIALQREHEAAEAQKKREEELKLQKERRTKNYLKKVKAHQPTKAAKLIKEQAEEMSAAHFEEPPKTWWGKFLKWLTN
jgi:hypothetical protein